MIKEVTAAIDGLDISVTVEENFMDAINKRNNKKIDILTVLSFVTPFIKRMYISDTDKAVVVDGDFNITLIVSLKKSNNNMQIAVEDIVLNSSVYFVKGLNSQILNTK